MRIAKGAAMTQDSTHKNRLLAALPPAILRRLERSLQRFELRLGEVVNEPGDRQKQSIFPENGVISVINTMQEGRAIEVAAIGREGMSGVPALLGVDLNPF